MTGLKSRVLKALPISVADRLRRFRRGGLHLHSAKMMESLVRLKMAGFSPKVVIDVGAASGEWTRSCMGVFPDSKFVMVEPNPVYREELLRVAKWAGAEYVQAALGSSEGVLRLLVPDDPAGSSFLGDHGRGYFKQAIDVPVRTLATISNDEAPDLVKLDVQGYELKVLEGAASLINEIEVVIAECSLYDFQEEIPLLHDVVGWMAARGFMTYEIADAYRFPSGALAQLDIMFVSQDSPLRKRGNR